MNIIRRPKVYLVGRQLLDEAEIRRFLEDHEVGEWATDTSIPAEVLPEIAGRVCYMSFSKPRPGGNRAYLGHIKEVGHGSVLEHTVWNFIITGVSRSFTHELVRHRAGFGYSQLSQRYVDESVADFVVSRGDEGVGWLLDAILGLDHMQQPLAALAVRRPAAFRGPLLSAIRDRTVRRSAFRDAVALLGVVAARPGRELIFELSRSTRAEDRTAAAAGLGALGDGEAFEALLGLSRDDLHTVRREAVRHVSAYAGPEAVERLIEMTGDPVLSVQAAAIDALGRLRCVRALDGLVRIYRGSHHGLRPAVLRASAAIGTPQAIELLMQAAANGDESTRQLGLELLSELD